jgi:hypothetical protein
MNQEQRHQMNLINTHPSGVEEWHCPQCQYHMALQWEPYKKLVLAEGEKFALHSAKKGEIQVVRPDVQSRFESEDASILSDELRDALEDFFRDVDFGD